MNGAETVEASRGYLRLEGEQIHRRRKSCPLPPDVQRGTGHSRYYRLTRTAFTIFACLI
jgi:hypothetical protein